MAEDVEAIKAKAGGGHPSDEAIRICRLLPFELSNDSKKLHDAMPASRDEEALKYMAAYVRGCISIPEGTAWDDALDVATRQLPARARRQATTQAFSKGQRAVNKRLCLTVYKIDTCVKVVAAIFKQFDSIEHLCNKLPQQDTDTVIEAAARDIGRNNHNKRAPSAPNVMHSFGVGLKYFAGLKRKLMEITDDPSLAVVTQIQDQCKKNIKKLEYQRGKESVPDPFTIRERHDKMEVRASFALFCAMPLRYTDFSKYIDVNNAGFCIHNDGTATMKHSKQMQKREATINLKEHMSEEELLCVKSMRGRQTIITHIRNGLSDLYPGMFYDWTSLRAGWEMHKRLIDGHDDQSMQATGLEDICGHSTRAGRDIYCKRSLDQAPLVEPIPEPDLESFLEPELL